MPDKDGIMKDVRKTQRTTVDEIAKDVNKHYGEGREWSANCANCAVAAEARARGYDVEAKPRDFSNTNHIPNWYGDNKAGRGSWTDSFDGMQYEKVTAKRKKDVADAIGARMQEYGDGSRGIIFVQWDGKKVGHYFNVSNEGGKVRFFDGQNGKGSVEDYFLSAKPSMTRLWRVDDKKITDYIRKVVDVNE